MSACCSYRISVRESSSERQKSLHSRHSSCPECDKTFNCPANLASHRRWHKPQPAVTSIEPVRVTVSSKVARCSSRSDSRSTTSTVSDTIPESSSSSSTTLDLSKKNVVPLDVQREFSSSVSSNGQSVHETCLTLRPSSTAADQSIVRLSTFAIVVHFLSRTIH